MVQVTAIAQFFTGLYFIGLGGLTLYGLHRVWLLLCWYGERRKTVIAPPNPAFIENKP